MIVPNTDVYLLKVPLEIDDSNQLTFANATAQHTYFSSLPKLYLDDGDYTYQRKDGVIRVGALIDDIQQYNYVMYRNTNHSSKWFYAFITGMDYLNDNVTAVSIKTDTWQSWQFELTYKRCFVEREHVSDDTFGKHTIPEGLETGEYVINHLDTGGVGGGIKQLKCDKDSWLHGADRTDPTKRLDPSIYFITFQVTKLDPIISGIPATTYMKLNGMFNGTYVFGTQDPAWARAVINLYDQSQTASGDDIISIFLAPVPFFDDGTLVNVTDGGGNTITKVVVPHESSANTILKSETFCDFPVKLDSYTPRNKKCYTYPFTFVNVDNHVGGMATFHYEDFNNTAVGENAHEPSFRIEGALSQGCSTALVPTYYKNDQNQNYTYSVAGAKFPQCSWKSDYYTNWCVQNAISQPFGAIGAIGQAGLSLATALAFSNPITAIGGALGLIGSIGNSVSARYEAERHPDQIKGQQGEGDFLIGANSGTHAFFTLYHMTAKAEYIKQADSFFDMFGYKVNEVKIPNITGRRNWNYVKTIGCYIEADIPQGDLQEIKSMFDKGITLWHNPTTFADYSQANDII